MNDSSGRESELVTRDRFLVRQQEKKCLNGRFFYDILLFMKLQVGVKIFLKNTEGKYLLLKRSLEKYPNVKGVWDIVGGRIEPGFTLVENLRREVMEETQLEITSEPELIFAQDIIPSNEKHVVRLTYTGETIGDPVLDTKENTEYAWLTLGEIRKRNDLDIYVQEILEKSLL
jgi:ADP-ribose pyrophosphatase YjhB (NUDIX family)